MALIVDQFNSPILSTCCGAEMSIFATGDWLRCNKCRYLHSATIYQPHPVYEDGTIYPHQLEDDWYLGKDDDFEEVSNYMGE